MAVAVAVAVAVVIPTPLRLQQPTVVLEGGWRGNACQVFKNTDWCLAPKGSSAFGIRVTGIRPSPQRLVQWWWWCRGGKCCVGAPILTISAVGGAGEGGSTPFPVSGRRGSLRRARAGGLMTNCSRFGHAWGSHAAMAIWRKQRWAPNTWIGHTCEKKS